MSVVATECLPDRQTGREQFAWSHYCLPPRPTGEMKVVTDLANMRRRLREHCPQAPGIYGYFDLAGSLIYVGFSAKLRSRLTTYFQQSETPRKEHCIASRATNLVWENVGHPFVALHRELELIQQFQPRLNVRGRSRRQRIGFICLTTDQAPRFVVRSQISKNTSHWWGPLFVDSRLRHAVDTLNRAFLLPDCNPTTPMAFADDRWLFADVRANRCLRAETGSCLAPCDGLCSRADYYSQLRLARALLDGTNLELVDALKQKMAEYATQQQYEQAARLHDLWKPLENLAARLKSAREPGIENGVYCVRAHRKRIWMLIAGGIVHGSVCEPLSGRRCRQFIELIDRYAGRQAAELQKHNRLASQTVNLWFRQHPTERDKVLPLEEARELFASTC